MYNMYSSIRFDSFCFNFEYRLVAHFINSIASSLNMYCVSVSLSLFIYLSFSSCI